MTLDAVIFDLDDTLIDWWGSLDRCLRSIADDALVDSLQDFCRRELWQTDPTGSFVWHRNTWALHSQRTDVWPRALPSWDAGERELVMRRFDEELWVGFFHDTVPTLDVLVDSHRLAVMSNNHLLPAEVERLRLNDWFEACVCPPIEQRKPDPAAFRLVLDALGIGPNRAVYVGDSVKADVLGARAAGLIPVWLDHWGDEWVDRPTGVHRIATLGELPPLLDEL